MMRWRSRVGLIVTSGSRRRRPSWRRVTLLRVLTPKRSQLQRSRRQRRRTSRRQRRRRRRRRRRLVRGWRARRSWWIPQSKALIKRFPLSGKRPTRKTFLNNSGDA